MAGLAVKKLVGLALLSLGWWCLSHVHRAANWTEEDQVVKIQIMAAQGQ